MSKFIVVDDCLYMPVKIGTKLSRSKTLSSIQDRGDMLAVNLETGYLTVLGKWINENKFHPMLFSGDFSENLPLTYVKAVSFMEKIYDHGIKTGSFYPVKGGQRYKWRGLHEMNMQLLAMYGDAKALQCSN